MYNLTVKDIIEQCNAKLIIGNPETECINFCKDTRILNRGDVYIGLKGENFNGSDFYKEALAAGASVCILENIIIDEETKSKYQDRSILLVQNTQKALQEMALFKRSKYNIPVIGITGSVGKTSTKDMIASVVSQKYNVLKTEGNFNNHIGLPFTILRLQDHDALVVEMGMNNLGEISLLTQIAKPSIAVITNVGTAHIGNLGSRENILKAKLEILDGLQKNGTLILNNDNDMLHMWNEKNTSYETLTFGIDEPSDLTASNIDIQSELIKYTVNYNYKDETIELPIISKTFIYNSLAALAVGKKLNIDIEKIKTGIKEFQLSKNRMEIIKCNNITILNDCYNANFDSMKSSIESLSKMNGNRKIALLGDMLELGEFSKNLHYNVGLEVLKNNIDILITVGTESKNIAQAVHNEKKNKTDIYSFNSNDEAIDLLKNIVQENDIILIKASNGMKFINIVNSLKEIL